MCTLKKYSTPPLFVTINPADTYHPLLGVLGGLTVEHWQEMTGYERTVFVARNPGPAAQFFDVMINAFLNIIVRHGDKDSGLFGTSETYYGMVEAQGRGTLHCHMLIWIKSNPGPQELRQRMNDDQGYQLQMFNLGSGPLLRMACTSPVSFNCLFFTITELINQCFHCWHLHIYIILPILFSTSKQENFHKPFE